VDGPEAEHEAIRRLMRELGEGHGSRTATPDEIARLRDCYGHRVLRPYVDDYILGKYDRHVLGDGEWPEGTSPDENLESVRETVVDSRGTIYLTDDTEDGRWNLYFFGRVRRDWRGPEGSDRIVVIFNAEDHRFVSRFHPTTDEAYVRHRDGFRIR
jgi:hypothetical protein